MVYLSDVSVSLLWCQTCLANSCYQCYTYIIVRSRRGKETRKYPGPTAPATAAPGATAECGELASPWSKIPPTSAAALCGRFEAR